MHTKEVINVDSNKQSIDCPIFAHTALVTGAKKRGSVTTERLAEVLCCHTMDRLLMIECLL